MYKIYDASGNENIIQHAVDVRECLQTGKYFLKPPKNVEEQALAEVKTEVILSPEDLDDMKVKPGPGEKEEKSPIEEIQAQAEEAKVTKGKAPGRPSKNSKTENWN